MPPDNDRPEYSVAMWGAPGTGKTTFLAALSIALARQEQKWTVVGADQQSTNELIKLTTQLSRDRAFPQATQGIGHYNWVLVGRVPGQVPRRWRWLGSRPEEHTVRIGLDLVDGSGEINLPDMASMSAREELIDNLAKSRGIVFLFDPIREFDSGDAFDTTFGVLAQLANRMIDSPEFSDGLLPHYVAVCVTKFDEIRVLRTADSLQLIDYDADERHNFPRVENDEARELFARLCDISPSGNADLVMSTLERHFRPDRIKYFVTSAIGFHLDQRSGTFNPENYQNQYRPLSDNGKPQEARIRGGIHPINVVEPLLWLAGNMLGPAEARKAARP